MNLDKIVKKARDIAKPFRVTGKDKFRLKDFDPKDTGDLGDEDKPRAKEMLQAGVVALAELQDRLYAQDRWSLLLVFQAMDAAGKDGAIKHVMSGVNPQGCQVVSFKSPSSEELDHDYLWRCNRNLPERGRIGIFNRSYYEEVLVLRVHRALLERQKLPPERITKDIWNERYRDIRAYERYLNANGTIVRKFFLNVSRGEQKKRFLERIDQPDKNWKLSPADARERGFWNDYMDAYENAIAETATPDCPWYVVPADNKWFTRIVVASAIIQTLDSLDLSYPKVGKEQLAELRKTRAMLMKER
ncbi:MAG TPA: polyphosphate kinase 2 family protein [Steroidobacteraceae bacterium]|nr:polyphosphate kinase 2 family protein [Steroidobacteraceae bacterium]